MSRWLIATSCILWVSLTWIQATQGVRMNHVEEEQRVDVSINGRLFTSYQYGPQFRNRPVSYPVLSPQGNMINRGLPIRGESKDHPHQESLFFAFGAVNSLDFWSPEGKRHIQHERVTTLREGREGLLGLLLQWIDSKAGPVLLENRQVTFGGGGWRRSLDGPPYPAHGPAVSRRVWRDQGRPFRPASGGLPPRGGRPGAIFQRLRLENLSTNMGKAGALGCSSGKSQQGGGDHRHFRPSFHRKPSFLLARSCLRAVRRESFWKKRFCKGGGASRPTLAARRKLSVPLPIGRLSRQKEQGPSGRRLLGVHQVERP